MKKIFGVFIFVGAVGGILFLLLREKKEGSVVQKPSAPEAPSNASKSETGKSTPKEKESLSAPNQPQAPWGGQSGNGGSASFKLRTAPLTAAEEKSIATLLKVITEYPLKKKSAEQLISELKDLHLKPKIAQDFNPDTGKMLIIRTDEALEGTRYFHAQLFEDENKKTYFQHLAFEVTPAPDAMEKAKAYLQQNGFSGEPVQVRGDSYLLWKKEGYIGYIKKMSAEDIRDEIASPFNAYDIKTDVGTVRCVIEIDVHPHGDQDGHLPLKTR